jgi:hypothetical protein
MSAETQTSPYQRIRETAQAALRKVQTEIRIRETELSQLRQQERMLQAFTGSQANGAAPRAGARRRVDWRAVLSELPKQFVAADIRKVPGIANKGNNEIFAAITRWIDARLVKRKARGSYERIG